MSRSSGPRVRRPWTSTVLAILAALLVATSVCPARAAPDGLQAYEHCIDGTLNDSEADQIGRSLAEHYYDLLFDAGVFPVTCVNKIAKFAYSKYDETSSLRLAAYFWSEPFFEKLYEETIGGAALNCKIDCLLEMDRRPLDGTSFFERIIRGFRDSSKPGDPFLLARALANQKLSPENVAELIDQTKTLGDEMPDKVAQNLFLLETAENARILFRQQRDPPQICVAVRCVGLMPVPNLSACNTFDQYVEERTLSSRVALKSWTLGDGQAFVNKCVVESLRGPLDKTMQTSIAAVFALGLFNPQIQLSDIAGNFRVGVFRNFDFISSDITQISNLDLSRAVGGSWLFISRIIDQLDAMPADVLIIRNSLLGAVMEHTPAYSHYNLLICRATHAAGNSCDRRSIYLSAIAQSLSTKR